MPGAGKRALVVVCLAMIVPLLSSCARISCPPPPCQHSIVDRVPPPAPANIKLFVTNDVHGYMVEDAKKGRIGYALLKGRIEECERLGYTTFLLDTGDAFSGSAYAQFDSGRSIAALMGKMGYRVMEPGNHAFDYNIPENDPLYYPNTLLNTVSANSIVPLSTVSLNLSRSGAPLPGVGQEPVILHDGTGPGGDGLRLVVIGIITPYVTSATNKAGLDGYDFGLVMMDGKPSHSETRQKIMDDLAEAVRPYDRSSDVVVVLAHVGHDDSDDYARGQLTGRDLATIPNVDFVTDAHSHTKVPPERIGNATYGSGGRYLEGFEEITVTAEGGKIAARMELKQHADLAGVAPSETMLAAIAEITEKLGMNDRLFEVPDNDLLSDDRINLESTVLGRFLCRTMKEIAGADLALYNSGGIRSSFSAGWATVGSFYNVTPFINDLQTFAMTGGQVQAMFESLPAINTNGFPQLYGMTVFAWREGDGPAPVLRIAGVLDGGGAPLEMDKTYSMALNNFMAGGGDGFKFEKERELHNFGEAATVMIRHLRQAGNLRLEELRANDTLVIFVNEALAREAWRNASEAGGEAIRKAG